VNVPSGIEKIIFERPAESPGAFNEADSFSACLADEMSGGGDDRGIGVMSLTESAAFEALAGAAGEVQLYSHCFIANEAGETAQLIEHGLQAGGDFDVPIDRALRNSNGSSRRGGSFEEAGAGQGRGSGGCENLAAGRIHVPYCNRLLYHGRMRSLAILCFCLVSPAVGQNEPVPTFGTTVVDSAGLRGTIYFLKPNTGILPDSFRRLKPKGTIYTRSLNVPPRDFREGFPGVTKRFEWFAIDYEGKFWIERAGDYRFALTSDDGSLLYLDDRLVIDNDRIHPPQTKETREPMGHGVHSIRVSYFQGPRTGVALVLQIAGPGEPLRIFTTDEFRPPHVEEIP
jgi:hypothetical protein